MSKKWLTQILMVIVVLSIHPVPLFSAQPMYLLQKDLNKTPVAERSPAEQQAIAKQFWEVVSLHGTERGYREFLKLFPASPWSKEAFEKAVNHLHQKQIVPFTDTRIYQRAFAINFRILQPPDSKQFGIGTNFSPVAIDLARGKGGGAFEVLNADLSLMAHIFPTHITIVKIPESTAVAYIKKNENADSMLIFSRDNKLVVVSEQPADKPTSVIVYDMETQKELSVFKDMGAIQATAISPDKQLLAVLNNDGKIRVWEINGQKLVTSFNTSRSTSKIAFDFEGVYVLSEGKTGQSKQSVYDLATQQFVNKAELFDQRVQKDLELSSLPLPEVLVNWQDTVYLKKLRPGVYQYQERYLPIAVNTKAKLLAKNISITHDEISVMQPALRMSTAIKVPAAALSPGKSGEITVTSAYHLPAMYSYFVQYRGSDYIVPDGSGKEPETIDMAQPAEVKAIVIESRQPEPPPVVVEKKIEIAETPQPSVKKIEINPEPAQVAVKKIEINPEPAQVAVKKIEINPEPTPAIPEKKLISINMDEPAPMIPEKKIIAPPIPDKKVVNINMDDTPEELPIPTPQKKPEVVKVIGLDEAPPEFDVSMTLLSRVIQKSQYEREKIPLEFNLKVVSKSQKAFDVQVSVDTNVISTWSVDMSGNVRSGSQTEKYVKKITVRVPANKSVERKISLGTLYLGATYKGNGVSRSFNKQIQDYHAKVLDSQPVM
ncbi:MAG: hypothetical protein HQM12_07310 [SAR324 cluster bacterium]|nr:hypothetical protein [SAR324 cluster bacterium]